MPLRDRHLTLVLAAVLVAVVLVGGGLALAWGHSQPDLAASQPTTTGPTSPEPATNSTPPSTGPSTTAPSVNPDAPVVVELSASAERAPGASRVRSLLSRYFTAINRHDYDAWLTTVSTQQSRRDRADWLKNYSTTRDTDVYVSDITPGTPMTARIQFASHQSLEFAPSQVPSTCVRWDVTYRIVDEGVGLRVGGSVTDPALVAC